MLRKCGNTKARSQRKLQASSTGEVVTRDLVADTFRDLAREFCASVGQHDYKLVAAITGDRVSISDRGKDHRGHLHEHVRADEVAVFVVDLFEVVEVQKQRRHARSVTTSAPDFVQQELAEVAGVVKFSEVVGLGKAFSLCDTNGIRQRGSDWQ